MYNLYCDQTTPWQGVYFFTNTVKGKIDTLYMCHSNFIVYYFTLDSNFNSSIHVAYQNLTFKSVKQNCCFRNQHWDAVKSCQALKKGCIKLTNQNAIFFARIYQTPIWIGTKINLFLIGIFTNQKTCHTNELDQHQSKMYCSHGT